MDRRQAADEPKQSIRLAEEQLKSLIARLDAARLPADHENRVADRYDYQRRHLLVQFVQPGGNTARFWVPSRDLSAHGVAFLHGGFVHSHTNVQVQLVTIKGMRQNVEGEVVRCRYVQGNVHEVGVRFKKEVNVELFAPAACSKRILVVAEDGMMSRLIAHHVEDANVEIETAESLEQLRTIVAEKIFGCVLVDEETAKGTGFEVVQELRAGGYFGMIAVLTCLSPAEATERCKETKADTCLPKPLEKAVLVDLLDSLDDEPLFSTIDDDEAMHELVTRFIGRLVMECRLIEAACARGDTSELERACRRLRGQAGSYGFPIISQAAEAIETAAGKASNFAEVEDLVKELARVCALVRTPMVPAAMEQELATAP